MVYAEELEKTLAQATNFYWVAWNKKPSMQDAFSQAFSTIYPPKISAFDKSCYEGMKILLSLCGSKFSEKYIRNLLPAFYNIIDPTTDLSKQQISDMLHSIYQKFLDWKDVMTVYFPVECIRVDGDAEISFGNVKFLSFNALLQKKHGEFFDKYLAEQPKNLKPSSVAAFAMMADIQKTRDTGKQIVNEILNVIQFVNPLSIVHDQAPHFVLSEQYPYRHAVTFRMLQNTIDIDSMYRTGSVQELHFPLKGDALKKWKESLGDNAVAIMQSCDNGDLSDILKQAIYWHATGERENSSERAFIYYTMALESIFTPTGNRVSMQTVMAESVALILGTSTENRLAIKKKVKKLYLLRSQIAHGKMNYVGNCDLETQRYFSYSTIKFIFSKKTEFNNQKDITNYIENLKFTLPDDIESTHVTETRGNDV